MRTSTSSAEVLLRRSLRTVRVVPVASPAALIIGAENALPGEPAAAVDGVADRLGRAEHPIEALEVGPGGVHRRTRLVGGGPQLGQERSRLAAQRLDLTAQRLERVEHAHQHDDQGGEPDRAQQRCQRDGEVAGGHRSCSVRVLLRMRSEISCSNP